MSISNPPAVNGSGQSGRPVPAWRGVAPVVLKVGLATVTLVLLSSLGGAAAYAAPVTLPVLFLTAQSSRRIAEALLWAVLAAATAFETGWVLTFLALGETDPWILLLPFLAAIAVGAIVFGGAQASRGKRRVTSS